MRKLYNTNREAEISSVVQDDISGMASLNFFFERGGKYYVPFAGGSAGSWNMVETTGKDFVLTDGIPGVSFKGSGKAKSDTFKISDPPADISFIRAGGIIKIDGSYYNITKVKDNKNNNPFKPLSILITGILVVRINKNNPPNKQATDIRLGNKKVMTMKRTREIIFTRGSIR